MREFLDIKGDKLMPAGEGIEEDEIYSPSDLVCPFCEDKGFDKVGLKYHLRYYCEEFKNTEEEVRPW